MSAALPDGVFHLLTADDELPHPYGSLVTVCREVVNTSALPPSCYPPEGKSDRDPWYCPACARGAARFSAETGDRASEAVDQMAAMKRPLCLEAGSGSAAPPPVAPDSSARAARDEDSQPAGYWGRCVWVSVYGGPVWRVGPRRECNPSAT